jgi:hypothetical protein
MMKRKPSTEATAAWIRLMRVQSRVLDAVEQDLKKAAFRRWPGMTRCWNCRARRPARCARWNWKSRC